VREGAGSSPGAQNTARARRHDRFTRAPAEARPTRQEPRNGGVTSVQDALALIRERGGSITSSRRLLLEAIFADSRHRTAQELAREVHRGDPGTDISTIYRNLDDLERLGVISCTRLGRRPAIYHRLPLTHGHLVCEGCGAVIEPPQEFFGDLAEAARREFGFAVNLQHLAVLGRCSSCQPGDARSPSLSHTPDAQVRTGGAQLP
jgi:Fe2+ or Zn2+ uptake regulation protein